MPITHLHLRASAKRNQPSSSRQSAWVRLIRMLCLVTALSAAAHVAQAQGQWTTNGNNINNTNTGNVGVGTTTPTEKLTVNGNFSFFTGSGDIHSTGNNGGIRIYAADSLTTTPGGAAIQFFGNNQTDYNGQFFMDSGAHNSAALIFRTAQTGGTITERMRVSAGGNVGIGLSAPIFRLDVAGGQINASDGLCIAGDCKTSWAQVVGGGGSSPWLTSDTNVYYNAGNVGVGTATPATKLDIVGVTKSSAFSVGGISAEKAFSVLWNNDVANQKVQVYWPASTQVDGIFEITVTGHYWYSNSNGGIKKRIVINGRNQGTMNMQESEVPFSLGFTRNSYTISDIEWDAANSRYYFVVANLDNKQNGMTIHVKSITPDATPANADRLNVTPIYTTDTRAFGKLYTHFISNVGIGTATPNQKLGVQGMLGLYPQTWVSPNVRGLFMFHDTAGGNIYAYNYPGGGADPISVTAATLTFSTFDANGNPNQRMTITNGGNVGVGTSTPARRLHVAGGSIEHQFSATDGQGYGFFISRDNNHFVQNAYFDGAAWRAIKSGAASILQTNAFGGDAMVVQADNVSRAADATRSFTQLFNVKLDGRVGIGTTTPTAMLDVNGGVKVSGNVNAGGGLCIADDCKQSWAQVGSTSQWTTGPSGIHYSAGNVGVGVAAPFHKFEVGGGGSAISFAPGNTSAYGPNALLNRIVSRSNYGPADGNSAAEIRFLTGASAWYKGQIAFFTNDDDSTANSAVERMRISNTGNVGIGTTTPTAKLDVAGNVNAAGLCLAGDCRSAWSQVGGGGSSQWTTVGSNNIHYSGGSVGVGTANPANRLHVFGGNILHQYSANAGQEYGFFTALNNNHFSANGQWDPANGWRSIGTGPASLLAAAPYNGSALIVYADATSRPAGAALSLNELFRIQNTGNVGIGTTSPASKLHVAGDGRFTGNLVVDGNIAAKYQDVAEWVESSQALAAGTVVALDPERVNQVLASTQAYDTRVAGVVSAQPGIALGEAGAGKVLVATTGRVRLKVDATRAPIKIGDLLVTSDVAGMAMKSEPMLINGRMFHSPGTIIGKALEPLAAGKGEILILLSLQ